jgi:hypothetical protein
MIKRTTSTQIGPPSKATVAGILSAANPGMLWAADRGGDVDPDPRRSTFPVERLLARRDPIYRKLNV